MNDLDSFNNEVDFQFISSDIYLIVSFILSVVIIIQIMIGIGLLQGKSWAWTWCFYHSYPKRGVE